MVFKQLDPPNGGKEKAADMFLALGVIFLLTIAMPITTIAGIKYLVSTDKKEEVKPPEPTTVIHQTNICVLGACRTAGRTERQ